MIGDLIIWFKTMWKQQVVCVHDYRIDRIGYITGLSNKRICTKCGKFER